MARKPRPDINDPDRFVFYRYNPSLEVAIIFVIAFALTTALHSFQIGKKRTWYFLPLTIGGVFEVVGYVGRIISHYDQWALPPFLIQALLLLVAPALFAASIYIILGRVILMVDGERYSLIRQKWLTTIFVSGDVLSFLVQAGGGGIMGSGTEKAMKLGEKLTIVGLFLQLLFFGLFVVVGGIFHYRLVRAPKSEMSIDISMLPWKRHLYALYIASGLILVRSAFRVVEYIMGNAGFLLRHEVFLYVFDGLLMLIVMAIFNWIHPSQVTEIYHETRENKTKEGGHASQQTSENVLSEQWGNGYP